MTCFCPLSSKSLKSFPQNRFINGHHLQLQVSLSNCRSFSSATQQSQSDIQLQLSHPKEVCRKRSLCLRCPCRRRSYPIRVAVRYQIISILIILFFCADVILSTRTKTKTVQTQAFSRCSKIRCIFRKRAGSCVCIRAASARKMSTTSGLLILLFVVSISLN